MSCGCKSVRSHSGVVMFFIICVPVACKADYYIARLNIIVIYDIGFFHSRSQSGINYDRLYKVADIGSFSAAGMDLNAVIIKHGDHFLIAFNDLFNNFTGDYVFVSSDRIGKKHVRCRAYSNYIVNIHDE